MSICSIIKTYLTALVFNIFPGNNNFTSSLCVKQGSNSSISFFNCISFCWTRKRKTIYFLANQSVTICWMHSRPRKSPHFRIKFKPDLTCFGSSLVSFYLNKFHWIEGIMIKSEYGTYQVTDTFKATLITSVILLPPGRFLLPWATLHLSIYFFRYRASRVTISQFTEFSERH